MVEGRPDMGVNPSKKNKGPSTIDDPADAYERAGNVFALAEPLIFRFILDLPSYKVVGVGNEYQE
jgi:hypothetical protein